MVSEYLCTLIVNDLSTSIKCVRLKNINDQMLGPP